MSRKKVEIRFPDGSTRPAHLGPDVDLEAEDIRDSRGKRVTQEYADAAVNAARRGRPSIDGEEGDSPRVQFRVPTRLLDLARARAAAEGKTVSQLAREAFEEKLAA